jgi:FkbH-like protein
VYETETNSAIESPAQLPEDALRRFSELRGRLHSRTVLPWSEHCTECVWPTCYSTCDIYSPRPDGGCRRFADGMVRVNLPGAANSYVLKIRFKRWAKLWTPGTLRMHSPEQAEALELRDYRIGRTLQRLPVPSLVKITAAKKRYGFKKKVAASFHPSPSREELLPAAFLLECYNPESRPVALTLTMRAVDESSRIPYQKLIEVTPGFHRIRIPREEIMALLELRRPFGIEVAPSDDDAGETTLFFGLMEFVTEAAEAQKQGTGCKDKDKNKDEQSRTGGNNGKSARSDSGEKKIKCVVWDLDHTLWEGVLVEDGAERLRLKPGIAEIIEELDQRGILHSVASKNNPEDALRVLKQFQLEKYFLCPQISWQPKSQGIQALAQQLNIGLDSLLFVDDSRFELEEVAAACPEVRTVTADQYLALPTRPDCIVPITAESRKRRHLYQVEASRQASAHDFSDDYMAFLRHCEIRLTVRPMTEENLERVHELTQRTNQMNFSGNRYDRGVLREILANSNLETYVLSCEDRFGSYGVIGFSLVDRREPRMTDLMFSCRIQSKRVEHAFLACILRKYIEESGHDFYANYRKTPRNAPSGKVFADLGMEEVETRDGVSSLRFGKDWEIPEDGVIQISRQDALEGTPA